MRYRRAYVEGGTLSQGAAYVFDRNQGGADNWGEVTKLTASDGAESDWFGISVSISGDTLVAGAWRTDVGGNTDQGAAYVFQLTQEYRVYLPLVTRDHVTYFEGPWEVEPNDSYLQANGPLHSGRDYYGYPNDTKDYSSIYLRTGGAITIDLTGHTGQGVQLQLFYQSVGNRVGYDWSPPYHSEYTGAAGWYYIYIYTGSGHNSTTPYTLRVVYQ